MTRFDSTWRLILIDAEIRGPTGVAFARLALDTAATSTMINAAVLLAAGYVPTPMTPHMQVMTASGIEFAPSIRLDAVRALDVERADFEVLAHTLPDASGVDGLLGLDFLRDHRLSIDFRHGEIGLS